jgi:RNA polymerase sigma factor (sigma-70 family)
MTDDAELLRQYLDQSSEAAFAQLVRRHIDFVYGVALRHARSAHRAEDVTQMVFADLARKGGALSGRTELVGWLYQSTRFAAAKLVRTEVRREARERAAQMIQQTLPESSAAIEWQRLQPVIDDALAELGEQDRSALLLRFFKNRSFAEIGAALRVSDEAARKRVDRALEKLRDRLARRGITSTAAVLASAFGGQAALAAPPALAGTVITAAPLAYGAFGPGELILKFVHVTGTSKTIAAAAIIAGSVSIGAAYLKFAEVRRAEADLAAQREAFNHSQHGLETARQTLASLRNARAGDASQKAKGANVSGIATPVATDPPGPYTDPRLLSLEKINMKGMLRIFYGPFFAQRHWSPAQGDAFLEARIGPAFTHVENGIIENGKYQAAGVAAEHDLLGDAGFQELQSFERGISYQPLLQRLAANLFAVEPLSANQAQQAIASWSESQTQFHDAPDNDDWAGLLKRTQGVLTPAQWEIFRQMGVAATGLDLPGPEIAPTKP